MRTSKNIGCGACQVIGNFKYTSSLGYTGGEKNRNEDAEQAEGWWHRYYLQDQSTPRILTRTRIGLLRGSEL